MSKLFRCEKCGELIERDKEISHKIISYTWIYEK